MEYYRCYILLMAISSPLILDLEVQKQIQSKFKTELEKRRRLISRKRKQIERQWKLILTKLNLNDDPPHNDEAIKYYSCRQH